MRKRSVGINVRVSVTEKRKMTLMAKRCGLSLSEYLRQRALGDEPGGHPPKEVFDVLDQHTNNKTRSQDSFRHQRHFSFLCDADADIDSDTALSHAPAASQEMCIRDSLGSFVNDSWWLNFTTPRCT